MKQKNRITITLVSLIICSSCNNKKELAELNTEKSLLEYVNPLMGTDSSFDLSNGNTYPAIATPWGYEFLDTTNR